MRAFDYAQASIVKRIAWSEVSTALKSANMVFIAWIS